MLSTANPHRDAWWSIWTQPRRTVQRIVESDARKGVIALAGLAGFHEALNRASMRSTADQVDMPVVLLVVAIAGPLVGIVSLYVGGALLHGTGKWLGGKASIENVRAALAWSAVPFILALLLWVPQSLLFGAELFRTETPRMDASPTLALAFGFLGITIWIWYAVVFLKCLGQVQGFSAWKAMANAFLGGVIALVAIVGVVLVWSWLQ